MYKKWFYFTLATAITVFIFSNSTLPASESAQISQGLLAFLLDVLPFDISHNLLRKLAHFTEFFAQGFFFALFFYECFYKKKKTAVLTAAVGFITGCLDEFLQLFSEGRGPAFLDVLIDFSGTLSSLIFLLIISFLLQSRSSLRC